MFDVFAAASACARTGPPGVLITVLSVAGSAPRHGGARMLVRSDGSLVGTIGGGELERRAMELALERLGGSPERVSFNLARDLGMCCGGLVELLIEPLRPAPLLTVYGAGHVGAAVAEVARFAGFRVRAVDDRDAWNNAERLPHAERVLADPLTFAAANPPGREDYVLIVTHAHATDQALVEALLPCDFAWLGLIGSRAKVARFLVRLRAAGVDPSLFARLSAPVGLDLGAETPEEIAIAIAADLVRVRRGSQRPPLPLAQIPLHARGGEGVAEAPALTPAEESAPSPREGEQSPPVSR